MPRETAMVRCLHRSGARAEEFLQLRWGKIEREARPVRAMVNGKGDKVRSIFFGPDAVEALQQYRDWLPDECAGDEQQSGDHEDIRRVSARRIGRGLHAFP